MRPLRGPCRVRKLIPEEITTTRSYTGDRLKRLTGIAVGGNDQGDFALPAHNSNLENCFRPGRNYTLTVTEKVRRSELLHLTPREYLAGDKNVKRNWSSSWCQAQWYVSQPTPVASFPYRMLVRAVSNSTCSRLADDTPDGLEWALQTIGVILQLNRDVCRCYSDFCVTAALIGA